MMGNGVETDLFVEFENTRSKLDGLKAIQDIAWVYVKSMAVGQEIPDHSGEMGENA